MILIMTGIGFTLGLLCGLLLQLPADGLPASDKVRSDDLDVVELQGQGQHPRHQRDTLSLLSSSSDIPSAQSGSLESHRKSPGKVVGDSANDLVDNSNDFSAGKGAVQKQLLVSGVESEKKRGNITNQILGVVTRDYNGEERRWEAGGAEGKKGSSELTKEQPGSAPWTGSNGENSGAQPSSEPITAFSIRLKNSGGRMLVETAIPIERNGRPLSDEVKGAGARAANTETKSSRGGLDGIVSGVLWSPQLEASCPKGFEHDATAAWKKKSLGMQVVRVEEGCGRMQNRLITFRDSTKACARYRLNTDQIQGEIFSYYLARLLNVTNLPPALLLPVDSLNDKWKAVHLDLSLAQWADGRVVVLTQWLDDLNPSYIPQELREDNRKLHPTTEILGGRSKEELCDLLQWSDLVIFDYLTANLDRIVNNMFNKQWNAEMMNNPAHNLERTKAGSLVFLDNESGLFHGYRLLDKYSGFHEALLASLCVFRDSTVRAVKVLHKSKSVGAELKKLFMEGEVHHKRLPTIPDKNVQILQDRLANVYDQIIRCEQLYGR